MIYKQDKPLVSIIIPTFNSAKFLDACLISINKQEYKNFEIIIVDNYSTDKTKRIAKKYTNNVYEKGPERSAQVNYGVKKSKGGYVYKVDSDFTLNNNVLLECVEKAKEGFDAVIVHNTPDVSASWIARIRKFEVDMYKYDLTHSSARFVKKDVFEAVGGFNESITAGEDYDFQNKLNNARYKTGFIESEALHLGEPQSIWRHMKKYYRYGEDFVAFKQYNKKDSKAQLSFFRSIYFKKWRNFISHPYKSIQFFIYTMLKFLFGAAGYAAGKLKAERQKLA